jgi:ABC-type nitrate/sulfonate/bicarbonate transport system substrate-binding protein
MRGAVRIAALVATALVAAASASAATTSGTTIKVAYGYSFDTNDGADPLGFAILQRAGITAKLQEMGSPDDAIIALAKGDVQLAKVSMEKAVPAIAAGAPIRLLLPADMLHDDLIVAAPGIKGVAALRGKTMLVSNIHGSTYAFAHALLVKAGIPDSAVTFAAVRDSEDRVVALQHGRADASVLDVVDWQRLLAAGGGYTVLGRVIDLEPRSPSSVWAVSTSFGNEHRAEVQTIVSALFQGYQRIYTPAGKKEFVQHAYDGPLKGADPRIAGGAYAWYVKRSYWPRAGTSFTRAGYEQVTSWWKANGVISAPPPPFANVWDTSFWRRADRAYRAR